MTKKRTRYSPDGPARRRATEKVQHSSESISEATPTRKEPLLGKRRKDIENAFTIEYDKRLDTLETSIRELQSSVALLKMELEKASADISSPEISKTLHEDSILPSMAKEKESASVEENVQVTFTEPARVEELRRQEESLTSRVGNLNSELREAQKKVDALHEYYISQNQALERELQARRLTIHQRAEEEKTKVDAEITFLSKHRTAIQEEIRALVGEKQALHKEVALGRSLSIILKNPGAISVADINLLIEKLTEARDARASGAKYLSDIHTREARRSLISSIMKIGKQQQAGND